MGEPTGGGSLAPPAVPGQGPAATIAACRARGAQRFDPVHFHFIEALARRAATFDGATRRLLEARLAGLLAAHATRFEAAQQTGWAPGDATGTTTGPTPHRPLAELVRQLDRQASGPDEQRPPGAGQPPAAAPAELKTLRQFRSTWSRLSVDQQLTRSLARVPENAGPLHSDRLLLLALQRMRALSPDYLRRLLSHVDALMWLDQVTGGSAPAQKNVVRGDADKKRKPGRGKTG